MLEVETTVIIIIDIQEKLLNAVFNKEQILKKVPIIASAAGILKIPFIVTEQYPKGLGSTIESIKENQPSTSVYIEKTSFNALNEPNVNCALKNIGRKNVIIAGIETHICVHQTVEALLTAGYNVTVIKDVCGSRSEYEHLAGIEVMRQNGANIKTTEMVLFELLKNSKNPYFKELQSLIK